MRLVIDRKIRPNKPLSNGLTFDGQYLWSNEHGDGTQYWISQLDPADGRVIKSFPGQGYAGLTWDGTHLWHAYFLKNEIYQLDPADGRVLKTIPAPKTGKDKSGTMGLAWDRRGQGLWTSDHVSTIFRIDPATGDVLARYDVPGTRAHGITWFRDHIWFADTDSKMVYELDPTTGATLQGVPVPDGTEPHGLTNDGECLWFSDTQKDPERDLLYRVRLVD